LALPLLVPPSGATSIEMSAARNAFWFISPDLVMPAGSKLVELVVRLLRVAICISLEIGQTEESDHINAFELRELLE
jgi:hypothetical protein